MAQDWRTVQIFLSEDNDSAYICEVQVVPDDPNKVRCTCPETRTLSGCKHTRYVRNKMADNGGAYPVKIPDSVTTEETIEAMKTSDAFRKFIVKYSKSVVL